MAEDNLVYSEILADDGTLAAYEVKLKTGASPVELTILDKYNDYPVTHICGAAFYNCRSLTSVTIPDSVTSIGNGAFWGCTSLTSITVNENNTAYKSIDGNLYSKDGKTLIQYATGKTDISFTIPGSVTSIGNGAFWGCTSLTGVTIPNSVTSIGYYAFYGCSSLTSITIPNNLTEIGEGTFRGCATLTNIEIPNDVTVIDDYAFADCYSLTSVTIPDSVTSIGGAAFFDCSGLTSVTIGNNVTSIGDSAFYDCDGLTSIIIPDSVTSIGRYAFYSCDSLTSVTIGNGVTSIGSNTFEYCRSLTSVTIGNSITSIASFAFWDCDKLVEVINHSSLDITAGSDDYGYVAYYAKEVHTSESKIINQNDYLFYTYNGVNYLLDYVGNDTELVLPDSYNGEAYQIYNRAFVHCGSLTSVTIGNSVTSIGDSVFSGCSSLENLTIPFVGESKKTAEDTYQYPFGYIFGTSSYTGGVATMQVYHGLSTDALTSTTYYIPESLKSVTITDGNILYGAFSNCSGLKTIITSNNVESISKNAFSGCTGVEKIVISKNVDDITEATLSGLPEDTIIYYGGSQDEWLDASGERATLKNQENKIEHFDLVFYPFKTVYGLNNKTEYKNSFKYTTENLEKIRVDLALNKTIAHNIVQPDVGENDKDIACIKNYLKLKARVTTTKKVTLIEEAEILNNIYKAIYTNFNARQVDFGEEIPYETLLSVLKNADYRIKEVNLDEPMLSTKFSLLDGSEEALSDAEHTEDLGNRLYNGLVRRNVLAGKISAFKYDNDFISEYDKTSYKKTEDQDYDITYPNDTSKKITKVESQFDVGTAFANRPTTETDGYVLKENEVIQFRVPNFKTTKTYPAYVNYFIKLNSAGSKNAIPATFTSLDVYMASKPDIDQPVRWETFVNQLVVSTKLKEIIITSTKEVPAEAEKDKTDKFAAEKKTKVVLFSYDSTNLKYVVADEYTTGTTYYYLPVDDDIFATFNSWIKAQPSKQPAVPPATEVKLEGIYRTVGVQEKPFGRLIDVDLKKYLPAYKFGAVSSNKEVLGNFYVQDTRQANDSAIGTADGLGQDADYVGVPKDGEYKLQPGEYLLINYTDSKTDEAGVERKTVVNKVYNEGDIIRANFELIDSALYHNNHSYSKRDGFSFAGQTPEGMFTLGTNEQIEIRDIVQVDLDEEGTYLYWTLNSDDPNALSNSFIFDEDYNINTTTRQDENSITWGTTEKPVHNAYTLKEGEHLYYTNSKKQDLVYYGAGTLIVKSIPNLTLRKYTSNGEVSEEDIMTNGLAANIPWQPFSFDKTKKLTIIENQYISLTEGDIIIKINGSDPTTAETMPSGSWNNWAVVGFKTDGSSVSPVETKYRLAEDEADSHLPPVVVDNVYWTVRSRLDFNMSKTTAQPLHHGDSLKITFKDGDDETLMPTEVTDYAPVYINSNYTCQAAVDTLDFTSLLKENEDFTLKLKVSSQSTPTISDHENLTLNNYINGEAKYTKFDFENLPADHEIGEEAFSLNISIPENNFGLIAIYYVKDADETATNGASIKAKNGSTEISGLEFFNVGDTIAATKILKAGLNIIKLSSAVKQLEVYADEAKKSTVVFGNLDIVTDINPKLDYRITDDQTKEGAATTQLNQLLKDIKNSGVAGDFYYNVPIQRANEIDLNPAIESDKLSSPLAWYDPNNVNRKFVISEIDADYLTTGITLTKASRV